MTIIKVVCCLAFFCGSVSITPAWAEATGQQRAQAAGRAILGAPAPRLMLKTIDGDVIDLGDLYGKKAVYLKFWATWCVPCRQQMPHFEHAYETAGPDMAVIAVDVGFNDSIEAVRAYRRQLGITMPIVFDDGSLGAAFHLRVTPTHIVIGRDGRIKYVGHLADQELDAELMAARTVARGPAARSAHGADKAAMADKVAAAHKVAVANNDPPPVGVGDLLPKRFLRTLDGQRFEFQHGTAQRTLTVLVFLSPWCESYLATSRPEVSGACRSAREQFSALSGNPRLRWLGIASGLWANSEDLRQYRAEYKVTIPLTLDASGELFRAFRVNEVPTVLIADAGGRIVRRIEGSAAGDAAALRTAVDGL
ncbi:MAG TPA: TlpA disulfide reductase family protein [Steroidobacteraceae bacterium]